MRPFGRAKHVEPVLHPGCHVSWWARLLALVCVSATWACVPGPATSTSPDWIVEVQRGRYGGLCLDPAAGGGGCQVTVTVHDDGRWSIEGFPEPTLAAGTVASGAASELAAILEEGWSDLTATPFTGTCPVAYDGQEAFYVVRRLPTGPGAERADADVRELRSCTFDLETPDASRWMDAFLRRWQELGLPE